MTRRAHLPDTDDPVQVYSILGGLRKLGKINYGIAVVAMYMGAQYDETIQRLEDRVLRPYPVHEQGFFPDPRGLELEYRMNDSGNRETYLVYKASGAELPIKRDIFEGCYKK